MAADCRAEVNSMMPLRARLAVLMVSSLVVAGIAAQQRDPRQYQQVLEHPQRVASLQVDRVVTTLGIKPGMRVADLGAGTGVFTLPLARAADANGKVYAIDVDPGLLAIVSEKAAASKMTNIETIVAGDTDPKLPEPVDLIFICDTLHHLPDQAAYVKQFPELLLPGGRVAVIDFAEGKWPAGHEAFTITPAQVDGWMQAAGFSRTATHTFLETNFFHVYERP
jgi:arsenite methyltransferase